MSDVELMGVSLFPLGSHMSSLRFGLVGCGRIAKRHAEILSSQLPSRAGLGAVCDVRPDRARALGSQFGVPFYFDMHEMLSEEHIDAISVLTESGLHADHVIDLARYGKPILVEKPMALTLADADRVIDACRTAGVELFVVKQNRFNLPVVKLREALDAGRFGRIVLGTVRVRWSRSQAYYDQDPWRGTWALDGGVLSNQASHHIDLLEWMLGDVEEVYAIGTTALVNIEAEDTAVVNLRFRSGALGVIEATTATRPTDLEGSISILGEKGSVEIAGFAVNEMRTWKFVEPTPGDDDVLANYSVNPPNVYGFGHLAYYEHMVDCLREGRPQLVSGTEGRKSLELITAIYASIESGRPVRLDGNVPVPRLGRRGR